MTQGNGFKQSRVIATRKRLELIQRRATTKRRRLSGSNKMAMALMSRLRLS